MMSMIVGDFPRIHRERRIVQPALVTTTGHELSWAELDHRVDSFCNALRTELGCRTGDRVGILANNRAECVEVMYAASRGGYIHTALNTRHHAKGMSRQLQDADVDILLVAPEYADVARQLQAERKTLTLVGLDDTTLDIGYEILLSDAPNSVVESHGDADAVYSLVYTSGTTGQPKGVTVTSRNEIAYGKSVYWCLEGRHDDRLMVSVPMFHRGGQYLAMTCGQFGVPVVLANPDPKSMVDTIERERITSTVVVPTILDGMVEFLESMAPGSYDMSSLRLLICGSSPVTPDLVRRFCNLTSAGFSQIAGMSEGAVTTCLTRTDYEEILTQPSLEHRILSAGRPAPGVRVRVVDDNGQFLRDGEVGELVFQGDAFVPGYWNKPEAGKFAWRGGWFHSGDLGRRDADGYIYHVDRLFGRIKTGAETVYAREVEQVLQTHPEVAEAAVVGIPDERWGEMVTAAVVTSRPNDPPISAEEFQAQIRGFLREAGLAGYQLPKRVHLVRDLPRTALGKTAYGELKEQIIADSYSK